MRLLRLTSLSLAAELAPPSPSSAENLTRRKSSCHSNIEFDAEGTTIRGWLLPAVGTTDKAPTVVMAHGFIAVKEMGLDR